ncbi:MAG: hypothetical protein ABR875_00720 [Minisyncoccia bacterium]
MKKVMKDDVCPRLVEVARLHWKNEGQKPLENKALPPELAEHINSCKHCGPLDADHRFFAANNQLMTNPGF